MMKLSSIITSLLLPFVCLAAKKSSSDRFAENYSKNLPLKLDDDSYQALTTGPRDYAVSILLTALEPRFGCAACRDFQPEWEILARSWQKGDKSGESRVLFGTLDFADGKSTFQALMLQHAPLLIFFPPTTGPNGKPDSAPLRFDFTSGPQTAESIHGWLSRHLPSGPHPPIRRPFNWLNFIAISTGLLGLVTLITVAYPYVMPVIQNRNIWAGISLISVLLFTSGHMFNHIRRVPYVASDGHGGISYFAGGFQNQFGLETQIVAAMYGVLAFSIITLAVKVPRIQDERTQQVAGFAWAAVLFIVYSLLLSVFRFKNGGYPFWLPPF